MVFSCLGCVTTCPFLSRLSRLSMHCDTGHEVGSQLAGYELTGARYELTGVRTGGIVNGLLRGQLRELLCDPGVILRESLQLVLRLL